MNQNIKIPFVDLYPQYEELQSEIDLAIRDIITRSDYITGPTVEKFEQAIIPFKFDGGIDMVETYIRVALEEGIVEQSGAMYYYKDQNFRGMNAVVTWFKENPDKYEELVDATKESYLTGDSDS